MTCPKCSTEIPDKFKFCPECGLSVSAESRQSGVEVSLGDMQTFVGAGERAESSLLHEPLSDRYELHDEIGRGGFAVVHKAIDKKLGRTVAIKQLHAGQDAQTLERFKREARVIAGLNHRNVVGVYDVGEDADGIYLVMEYVEGGTLRELLKKKGRMELPEALPLIRGIAQGLSHAHRNNLVHRDIKPSNILLQNEGGGLIPKIVDFGLAQAGRDSELSMTGYGMGSPWYMPPEQRRDAKTVNHTADIYALGKVLYEMVTGEIPDQLDPAEIPPPPLLAEIIFKCTKPKPFDRYFSVEELLQALERIGRKAVSGSIPQSANSCPQCGRQNPDDVKFCEGCGAGLLRNCPECDRGNSIHKQFCGGCGTDVEGFANAQEILQRMEGYAKEKKWSRIAKEYDLFEQDVRLPGKKGAELRVELENTCKGAAGKISQREDLKKQIDKELKREEELENVIELVTAYQEIDPHNTEINALPFEIRKRIDERDFRRVERDAGLAEEQSDYRTAIGAYQEYLEKHGPKKHADEAHRMAEVVLPERMAEHAYQDVYAKVGKIKEGLLNEPSWWKRIKPGGAGAALCFDFCAENPNHKNVQIIAHALKELEDLVRTARDELAFEQVEAQAKPLISQQKYEEAQTCYRHYLESHDIHREEAERMVSENLPRLAEQACQDVYAKVEQACQDVYAKVGKIKEGLLNEPSWGKRIKQGRAGIDLCTGFCTENPNHKNVQIIAHALKELEDLVRTARDELAFEQVETKAKPLISQKKYEEAKTCYRHYLESHDIHREEAERMVSELIDERETKERKVRIGCCCFLVLAICMTFFGLYPALEKDMQAKMLASAVTAYSSAKSAYEQAIRTMPYEIADLRTHAPEPWAAAERAALLGIISAAEPVQGRKHYETALAKYTEAVQIMLEKGYGLEAGRKWVADLGGGVQMDFMPIAAGSFQMGSNNGDSDEKPVHRVTLSQPYWLAKTEVTQTQWMQIMGGNPSYFKGSQNPVERVSWNDAVWFCKKLTERDRQAGRLPADFEYALPTEAQWEYACRAGTTGDYAGSLDAMGWYNKNSGGWTDPLVSGRTHPVGTKQANAWGLYDMHGNVWEWCSDWYGGYPAGSVRDPGGAGGGSFRVTRGNSWGGSDCRSANRGADPSFTYIYVGFRPLVQRR